MRRLIVLLIAIPSLLLFAQSPKIPKDAIPGYQSITANDLSARLHFIASPELEGRETTFRGQKVAARYIASEFQRLGLKPIGDSGSYYQRFMVEATKVSDASTITVAGKQGSTTFAIRKDFLSLSGMDHPMTGPVYFIGYMDTQVDTNLTKGKIVVAFAGRKDDGRDTSVTPMRRLGFIRQFPGSLATLVIADETGGISLDRLATRFGPMLERGMMRVVGAPQRAGRLTAGFPTLISPALGDDILKEAGQTSSQMRLAAQDAAFRPIVLAQTGVSIDVRDTKELKTTENIVGLLEGSDRKLKDEVVAFTAHYDHLGIASDGTVYPGADDDGSGTVSVIELAEAFTQNPMKPKRSILFMTVVGEEKGLWGSEYYVNHPLRPLDKTVADLNVDMIGRVDKKYEDLKNSNYTYVIGSDKISTQLDSILKVANKETVQLTLDYTYNDDKDPNQFYRRSDHYNFARHGIPIVFFFTGEHADYHKTTDTVDKILFDRMAKVVRLIYATGWKVANMKGTLAKNVGSSMFGK